MLRCSECYVSSGIRVETVASVSLSIELESITTNCRYRVGNSCQFADSKFFITFTFGCQTSFGIVATIWEPGLIQSKLICSGLKLGTINFACSDLLLLNFRTLHFLTVCLLGYFVEMS